MNTRNILLIALIINTVLLSLSILFQNRAEGLGTVFGGGGEVFRTKRGMEKFLYNATIVLALTFAALALTIAKIS